MPKRELEILEKSEQSLHKDLQSGLLLCKSFSPQPFWVIFGKVDSPRFLKEKYYVNDDYNTLHRDKNGYAFLMLPLMTVGTPPLFGKQTFDDMIEHCWNMGLREHPLFVGDIIYHLHLPNFTKKIVEDVAKDFAELYTKDELIERLGVSLERFYSLECSEPHVNQIKEIGKAISHTKDVSFFKFHCEDNSKIYSSAGVDLQLPSIIFEAIKICS